MRRIVKRAKPQYATIEEIFADGEAAPPRKPLRALLALLLVAVIGGGAIGTLGLPFAFSAASAERSVVDAWEGLDGTLPEDIALAEPTVLLDRNGNPYATFFAEDRTPVTFEQINPVMIDALLAIEDDRFYEHGGLDVEGLARAAVKTLTTDQRQGGSTITQQLVENLLVSEAYNDPSKQAQARAQDLEGKMQEFKYAVELEKTMSKDEILTAYLNTMFFGNGAYGVETAAKYYFNTTASALTLPQAAMLAGLMRSPVNYDPVKNPEAAKNRRDTVLMRMAQTRRISEEEKTAAQNEPVVLQITKTPNGCEASTYALYCAYVRDQMLSDPIFGDTPEEREENLYRGGLTITTALDPVVNDASQAALSAAITPENRVAIGSAIVEPGTGLVAALTQTKPYGQGENQTEIIYATRPSFQPGSSFKAFTLLTALEQGISPDTVMSAPTGYRPRGMDSPPNGFANDSHISYGSLDMRSATRQSVNVYYIKLIEKTGVLPVADMARRMGVTSIPTEGPRVPTARSATFALGAWEVSPLEMASAYAAIAANGVACTPTGIISAVDRQGIGVDVPNPNCHQAVEPNVAKTAADILQGPLSEGGTADGYALDRPAAGKTGTTNNYAATWFVGFTPQYATSVWVGDPRGGSSYPLTNVTAFGRKYAHFYGATVAAPVWHDTMMAISSGKPVLPLGSLNINAGVLKTKAIPDVRGMDTASAMTAIINAGYKVELNPALAAPDPLLEPDRVVAQTPNPGVNLDAETKIVLTLSAGSRLDVVAPSQNQNGNQ